MSIFAICQRCRRETTTTLDCCCISCLRDRVRDLEDSLEKIGKLCLHTPASSIWEEVKTVVGEHGEKRVTNKDPDCKGGQLAL